MVSSKNYGIQKSKPLLRLQIKHTLWWAHLSILDDQKNFCNFCKRPLLSLEKLDKKCLECSGIILENKCPKCNHKFAPDNISIYCVNCRGRQKKKRRIKPKSTKKKMLNTTIHVILFFFIARFTLETFISPELLWTPLELIPPKEDPLIIPLNNIAINFFNLIGSIINFAVDFFQGIFTLILTFFTEKEYTPVSLFFWLFVIVFFWTKESHPVV